MPIVYAWSNATSRILGSIVEYEWLCRMNLFDSKSTFVLILTFLWPQNLLQGNGSDHHKEDEDVGNEQQYCHSAAEGLNGAAVEGFPDRES